MENKSMMGADELRLRSHLKALRSDATRIQSVLDLVIQLVPEASLNYKYFKLPADLQILMKDVKKTNEPLRMPDGIWSPKVPDETRN